jgi:hypothetical protein
LPGKKNNGLYISAAVLYFALFRWYPGFTVRGSPETMKRRARKMFAMIVGIVAVVYVGAALLSVLGLVFGTLFSVAISVAGWVFSGKGILLGIIIGFLAVKALRGRNTINEG